MKAIICGTKSMSMGRLIGRDLAQRNWQVWLYSRSAIHYDKGNLHKRRIDVTDARQIESLFAECGDPTLAILSADTGNAFGLLPDIPAADVRSFVATKVLGSILFVQELLRRGACAKVVFLGGRLDQKSKDCMLYGTVNHAIMGLIEETNRHYGSKLQGYYLETPVIWPSRIAHAYVRATGTPVDGQPPSVVWDTLLAIIEGKHMPGFVACTQGRVL
ncbi:hypothetical protein FJY93_01895 [Candidatus Kaiserbacteria bacterium]|nr:hypothetical protein [Candidatus Kaiserbacteria bacterium]